MPERAPKQSQELASTAFADVLNTESATVRDVAYGKGVRYCAGRCTRLEIFPKTGVTRLTAPGVRIELFDNAHLDVSPGGVEFSRTQPGQAASLTVMPGGRIVFTLVAGGEPRPVITTGPDEPPATPPPPTSPPVSAPEGRQEPGSNAADTSGPPPAVHGADASQLTREPSSPKPPANRATNQQPAAAETVQERIALTGRLGRNPAFHTTKTGSLAGRFPLAVHHEDGNTSWHTVLAFGSRAEQLQRRVASGELIQGREVDVVGYLHVNTRPGKDGRPRQVQEVYAVAVKKR